MRAHKTVVLFGTLDTKREPLDLLARLLHGHAIRVYLIDLSRRPDRYRPPRGVIAAHISSMIPWRPPAVAEGRAAYITYAEAALRHSAICLGTTEPSVVAGIGGSAGTSLVLAAQRGFGLAVPRVLVTTVSGLIRERSVGSLVTIVQSPVDLEGHNPILRASLFAAAEAIHGYVTGWTNAPGQQAIGLTQLGVTTPLVKRVASRLIRAGLEPISFHAFAEGTLLLMELLRRGALRSVLDLTLSDAATSFLGGRSSLGFERVRLAAAGGLARVVVPGAINSIVFHASARIPRKYLGHVFLRPTPDLLVMRADRDDSVLLARALAESLRESPHQIRVLLPLRGLSESDRQGGERGSSLDGRRKRRWFDAEANEAFGAELQRRVSNHVRIEVVDRHINDQGFADMVADRFLESFGSQRRRPPKRLWGVRRP